MGRKLYDWAAIQRYHDAGNNRDACMAHFGFSIAAWYKAIQCGHLETKSRVISVDWNAVRKYYEAGHTFRASRVEFGFSAEAWRKAVKRHDITPRVPRWPLERVLRESKSRLSVKRRLLEEGLLKNECEECGITNWRDRPLSIHLDHRNGIRNDHRLENLRMLCPNCHSQTPTFGTRNRKQRVRQQRMNGDVPGGVTGNTRGSEPRDSRFETLPGSISWPHRLEA